jgi:hypothetical protein
MRLILPNQIKRTSLSNAELPPGVVESFIFIKKQFRALKNCFHGFVIKVDSFSYLSKTITLRVLKDEANEENLVRRRRMKNVTKQQ